jgi:glycosidase
MSSNGVAKTPQGWNDIRMFQPWDDEGKRLLNPKLLEYHRKFVDMLIDAGVDGIRADVARAKPVEFWDIIIPYSRKRDPQFAWLAESYTYEDASPQANMPYDRPEDSLRAGFDAYYGQYHIFHEWQNAKEQANNRHKRRWKKRPA